MHLIECGLYSAAPTQPAMEGLRERAVTEKLAYERARAEFRDDWMGFCSGFFMVADEGVSRYGLRLRRILENIRQELTVPERSVFDKSFNSPHGLWRLEIETAVDSSTPFMAGNLLFVTATEPSTLAKLPCSRCTAPISGKRVCFPVTCNAHAMLNPSEPLHGVMCAGCIKDIARSANGVNDHIFRCGVCLEPFFPMAE